MSATFWNIRRRQAAKLKNDKADAVETVKEPKLDVTASKPPAKKGGAKNGK